jgi:hypothetical protein
MLLVKLVMVAGSPGVAGPGGNGISNSITGSATYYAGGGGGGSQSDSPSAVPAGTGGLGGGGNGSARGGTIGTAGTANTGGGAGGGWSAPGSPTYAPLRWRSRNSNYKVQISIGIKL